jgi:uncharacterized protein
MRTDILLSSGKYFNFLEPEASDFGIKEIAHALAHICRYGGHTGDFYSVAQHSIAVSYLVPQEHALAGLLHDAAEAFMGDVVAPLKQLLPDYKALEEKVETAVLARFGLPAVLPACVKEADLVMLATEQRDLMPAHDDAWEWESVPNIRPLATKVKPLGRMFARLRFLIRFEDLTGTRLQLRSVTLCRYALHVLRMKP